MTKGTIVILGATSWIARGAAFEWARRGHSLILTSRDKREISRIASDLSIRFDIVAESALFDALDIDSHALFFEMLEKRNDVIEGAVIAFGYLGANCSKFEEQERVIRVNYLGAVSAISGFSNLFSKQKKGFIIGISSVAGDRGRQSNFVYGSAKGALNIYLEGLRNKLHPYGVHVMTVKPGFVDTAMTFGLSGLFLVADPFDVGKQIVVLQDKKKNTVYIPGFWKWIMMVIKAIPETIFKRLKL